MYLKNLNIGFKLKRLRLRNGLSVREVSALLCQYSMPTSTKTIYKWESNSCIPDLKTLNSLAYIFNVSINNFFSETSTHQALTDGELKFINMLRNNEDFRKIIYILTKSEKEVIKRGNKPFN